jgi:hypothetical protein
MNITFINTLDGKTRVEWWDKEQFQGRTTKIYMGESAVNYLAGVPMQELIPDQIIPIPDSVVLCDFCNMRIEEFPVPVVFNHALCRECFGDLKKRGGNNHGS